jgi:hypothetical protein
MFEYASLRMGGWHLLEVFRIIGGDQTGEGGGKIPDFDLRCWRPLSPYEVEQECDANIVDIFKSRGIDDEPLVRVAGEQFYSRSPNRRRRICGYSALKHEIGGGAHVAEFPIRIFIDDQNDKLAIRSTRIVDPYQTSA